MTVVLKLLAIVTPIAGGGIAIPLYLNSAGKDSTETAQSPVQVSSEKEECEFSEIPKSNPDLVSFLSEKSLIAEDYGFVSCGGHKLGLFDENWMGLFPKEDLETAFSLTEKVKFPVNLSINKVNERWDDSEIVFSNPDTHKSIKGKWGGFSREKFGKESLLLSMSKDDRQKRNIYILTDKVDANKI